MKKLLILSAVFATLTLASCSEDNTYNPDFHYAESTPMPEPYDNPELNEVFIRPDSISSIHTHTDQICEQ